MNLICCPICKKKNFRILTAGERQIVQCVNDGLAFVNPMPSEKEILGLYGPSYFVNFDRYFKNKDTNAAYFRKKLVQIEKKMGKKGKILDVGCATGFFLQEAKKNGWQELGIDVSASALSYCLKEGLKVKKGTLKSLSLPADSFNAVVSLQTIEHETDPVLHAKEICKILKPGGLAVFTTPDHDGWTRTLMGSSWFGYKHKEHMYFLSKKTMIIVLKKAGFTHIKVERDDKRVFTLRYYMERIYDFYPYPAVKFVTSAIKSVIGTISVPVVTDPWGDMILFARKKD